MNFIETLKSVGGVKPCRCDGSGQEYKKLVDSGQMAEFMRNEKCWKCHGTGQIIDLAPLLAKPKELEKVVEKFFSTEMVDIGEYEKRIVGTEQDLLVDNLFIFGPQRAHALVYEVARQLGGTAVVAEPKLDEWTDKDGSYKMSELKKGKLVKDVGYRLSLPIPPDATVLFVTDKMDEQEMLAVMETTMTSQKEGSPFRFLTYVLALISAQDKLVFLDLEKTEWKVISLHKE